MEMKDISRRLLGEVQGSNGGIKDVEGGRGRTREVLEDNSGVKNAGCGGC